MKKILGLLLALAMVLSLSAVAFANTSGQLQDGDNYIELPYKAKEASTYTYTATKSGTLYIMVTEFFSSNKGAAWKDSYGTIDEDWGSTKLTFDGQELSGQYYGSVEVVKGQTYTISWVHAFNGIYGWSATLNLSYTGELLPTIGTEDLPAALRPDQCPVTSIQIPAGQTVFYTLYDFSGGNLVVKGQNAYVMFRTTNPETMELEYKTYEAVDGVVTVPIQSDLLTLQIGNDGSSAASFTLDCDFPKGIQKNPAQLVLGDNVAATKAEDYEGYYYTWTAPRSGKLTLTFSGEGWFYHIQNKTANKFLGSSNSAEASPVNPVVVEFQKGDTLIIRVNSYNNATQTIPGGDVPFTAAAEYGHEYKVTASEKATCCTKGFTTYTCSECGHSYTEETELDPKNHEALTQLTEGFAPTCEEDGCRATWECSACGGVYSNMQGTLHTTREEQVIPASGHSFCDWTDLGNGQEQRTCSVCGHQEQQTVQCKHPNTEKTPAVEPDCTNPGKESDTVCSDCGEILEAGAEIPALGGHSFGEWTTVREATAEQEGLKQRSCSACGEVEEEVLPKLEQQPTEPGQPSQPAQPSAPAESQPTPSEPNGTEQEPQNGNGWIWILVAVVGVVAVAAVVLLTRKRK